MNDREIAMNIVIKMIDKDVFVPDAKTVVNSICEAYKTIFKTVSNS